MGDFYAANRRMSGFPRGDPGFFSFLGNLAKSAVGFIPGVGPIASKAISVASSAIRPSMSGAVAHAAAAGRGALVKAGGAIVKHPALSAAGAAGALAVGAGARSLLRGRGAGTVTASGRRHPRMNPCNPRALRRAIARTHRFAKLAMKTIHLVHPKKKARFGGFKRRKRSK